MRGVLRLTIIGRIKLSAYYNEIDPYAAQWLRNLITAGLIAPGDVDTRSIEDVKPDDLKYYTQCHFFAGIGVWSHSLRQAGWPDDKPVWTGSCPCQPFSSAGKGKGFTDERHLWPAFFHLIEQRKPNVIFGEQVASKDGLAWLDLVQTDLEAAKYTVGALDLCAAGFGAPHIRQRLFWVADTISGRQQRKCGTREERATQHSKINRVEHPDSQYKPTTRDTSRIENISRTGQSLGMGITNSERCSRFEIQRDGENPMFEITGASEPLRLAHSEREQCEDSLSGYGQGNSEKESGTPAKFAGCNNSNSTSSATNGYWRDTDWLYCRDEKWRPVEPSTLPLAHGVTNRVGRLRAYGNAIVAPVAEEFIRAYMQI